MAPNFQQMPNATGNSMMMSQVPLQAVLYRDLQSQPPLTSGWQSAVTVSERLHQVCSLVSQLRLVDRPYDLQSVCAMALKFERSSFENSLSKEAYLKTLREKNEQMTQARSQFALQQHQLQMAQRQAQHLGMAGQQSMAGQMARAGISQQQPQQQPQHAQPFQHLQHQMQPSPLPGQSQQQMGLGMGMVNSLPQNLSYQQQLPMAIQQQPGPPQPVQVGQQPLIQPQQVPPNRQPGGQPTLTPQDQALINDLAQKMMNAASEEEKNNHRQFFRSRMDQATAQRIIAQGIDPAIIFYRNQAMSRIRQKNAHQQAHVNFTSATPMQAQRSNNPGVIGGQGQQQQPQMSSQDFGGFLGNGESFMGNKGQEGVIAQQDPSQMTVQTTLTQGASTPQPIQGLPAQLAGASNQRPMPGNPGLIAQQQPVFSAQPVQQERPNHPAQQAAIRATAQAEARKMGLQGQPGGMGPMPPQQSPAMGTLNTPVQTSQQNSADIQSGNAQFGQAIDPRYIHIAQQRSNPGSGVTGMGINVLGFPANMTPDQRQMLSTMSKDQRAEFLSKWNASRALAGKPQSAMQVPGVRPNQHAGQMGAPNSQALAAQFINGIPSEQQQQILANMTQQQQVLLRNQVAAARGQGHPPNIQTGRTEHAINQIDLVDIPREILHNPILLHNPIFQQVPPEVKRWVELKQWISQNPAAMQAGLLETVKTLQRNHFQTLLRARSQALQQRQNQANALNVQEPKATPVIPSAPVAQMSQGNPIIAVSQEEIQKARGNPRCANMNDEEIKQMIIHHRLQKLRVPTGTMKQPSPSQQSTTQDLLQHPSVPQPTQVQQNLSQSLKNGTKSQPGQGVQPGQPPVRQQPSAMDAARATSQTDRAGRPVQTSRSTPQTASPSQTQKNSLKRANSDDVVEVPNPNTQQVPQSIPQQPQNQRKLPQQPYTPQQLAALSPEQRHKYEIMVRQAAQSKAAQVNPAQASQIFRSSQADIHQCDKALEEEAAKLELFDTITMTADMRNTISTKLLSTGPYLRKVKQVLPKWLAMTHDHLRLRSFCRSYIKVSQQFLDPNTMEKPKSVFSITAEEIEHTYSLANSMIQDIARHFPGLTKSSSGAGAPPTATPAREGARTPSQPAPAQVPLNAANLRQQQQALKLQQSQTKHGRANSRSQPPAAPTSAQPPFPIDSPSQGGMPYQQLTQDQLRLPPAKKQKPSPRSTPVLGNLNSITITPLKTSSPELKNQPVEPPKEEKVLFTCREEDCHDNDGFEDKQALERHINEEHIIPLSNPLQFAKNELATLLGLEPDGTPKSVSNTVSGASATATSQPGRATAEKADNTPAATTITPMDRQTSNGTGVKTSPASNRLTKGGKADDVKDGFTQAQVKSLDAATQHLVAVEDPWANSSVNPQDLLHNFQGLETGAGGAISDMSVYRAITPNDTPESSKDGASEPTSDITEGLDLAINLEFFEADWNPFGPADMDDLLTLGKINVDPEDETLAYPDNRWGDFLEHSDFDKPFTFDTTGFSMNVE